MYLDVTPLGVSMRGLQKDFTEERRPTLNVDSTIPWAVSGQNAKEEGVVLAFISLCFLSVVVV